MFLAGWSILSVMLGYAGIDHLKEAGYSFDGGLIKFADSGLGVALIWLLAIAIPIISGVLCFRDSRWVGGLLLLFCWSAIIGVFGISLWLEGKLFHGFP